MIQLNPENAIASGGERIIFYHPESPDKLIKVLNPRYIAYIKEKWPLTIRLRRLSYYWFYINEFVELFYSRENDIPNRHYLQNILGIEDTNLGPGLVVAAVTRKDGSLAYTLNDLIQSGLFNEEHHRELEAFLGWLENTYIIVRDLRSTNLVWDSHNGHFVLIDGFGGKPLPSLRTFSSRYNRRSNRKRAAKLRLLLKKKLRTFTDQIPA